MYNNLETINQRPELFGIYSAESLWADPHRSQQMLAYHLNESLDISSRNIDFIQQSTNWISTTFSLTAASKVCDFGCGPGLYTSRLAQTGANITGIDFSQNSIEYARAQAAKDHLPIEYIHANYLDNPPLTGSYDLISMIMCDFCALSPEQRQRLLGTFASLLDTQGKVLLDVYSHAAFNARSEAALYEKNQLHHFWFAEDYYGFVNTFKYDDARVVLDKYTLFTASGQTETVYNWLQYYDLPSLEQELAAAGFSVTSVYADVCGNSYTADTHEFAVILEKAR